MGEVREAKLGIVAGMTTTVDPFAPIISSAAPLFCFSPSASLWSIGLSAMTIVGLFSTTAFESLELSSSGLTSASADAVIPSASVIAPRSASGVENAANEAATASAAAEMFPTGVAMIPTAAREERWERRSLSIGIGLHHLGAVRAGGRVSRATLTSK